MLCQSKNQIINVHIFIACYLNNEHQNYTKQKSNNKTNKTKQIVVVVRFYLTVLWWIRLHLLYAASKMRFGVARLLRVLLIPNVLPNGLRIYLRLGIEN